MHVRPIDVWPWLTSVRPLLTVVDLAAVLLAGLSVSDHVTPVAVIVAALAGTVVSRGADLHRSRLVLSVLEDLPKLVLVDVAATLVLAGVAPLAVVDEEPQWLLLARFAGVLLILLLLLRAAAYAAVHARRRSGQSAHPVVVVGAGTVGRRLARAFLDRPEYGLAPVGMIDCGPELQPRELPVPLLGDIRDLRRVMEDLGVDDVVFAFPSPPDDETIAEVRRCVQADHQVFVVPRFFEMMGLDHHRRVEVVRDVAVMRLRRWGLRRHTMLAKRLLDIVVSLVALVLLSPVLVLCAIAVRLETGPGVIFRQTRVTAGGRTFTLMKFRSLRPATEEEGATQWSIDHDDRLGPVGRFLRRTSLDELPQLFNILRGDMSLVGPRPERPYFVREFSRGHQRYDDRHRVPTGLTGWAQVNNLRGDTSIDDRVRFDNFYIENWSLWSDVKIMVRTVRAVGRPEPARRSIPLVAPPSTLGSAPPPAVPPVVPPAPRGDPSPLPAATLVPARLRMVHVSMPTSEGVAQVVTAYVRDQVDRGWDVTVVCPPTGWLGEAAGQAGARVVDWPATRGPGLSTLREAARLRRVLAALAPDVVHLHSAKAGLAGRLALRGRLPTVFQPHAWSFLAARGLQRRLAIAWERFAVRWTSELVCVSESERQLGARTGIDVSRAVVVPNGVDVESISAVGHAARRLARHELGLPEAPTVVCVGRLTEQKGQRELVQAWPAVRELVPGARLYLVGDGPDRELLEQQAGADASIRLVGARDDVTDWLAAADVVAAPSRWEGMPLLPLEAMASSRSVVAVRSVGMEETIPAEAGALVPVDSTESLVEALALRLVDRRMADAEGRRGRLHVERHRPWSRSTRAVARVALRQAGSRTRTLA